MSWTTCSSWPCIHLQRSQPTSALLWFCNTKRQKEMHKSHDNVTQVLAEWTKSVKWFYVCLKNWNATFCKLKTDCKLKDKTGKFLAHQIKNKRAIHEKKSCGQVTFFAQKFYTKPRVGTLLAIDWETLMLLGIARAWEDLFIKMGRQSGEVQVGMQVSLLLEKSWPNDWQLEVLNKIPVQGFCQIPLQWDDST